MKLALFVKIQYKKIEDISVTQNCCLIKILLELTFLFFLLSLAITSYQSIENKITHK
jgi:hypothetical protein